MPVTRKDVEYIAALAKLRFSETELDSFTGELNQILNYIEKLNELDTSNVEPLSYPVEVSNVLREDKRMPSVTTQEALRNSPDSTEEFFRVPKVINVE
ncbi:MAG: Asp-tRNA(Asn)/Glu-tRNA(Gln) amidotransferase subunit GatC [Ignavibacteria bacterium]|jgi:aspartyl-tRNA(Asn)/glutamyl-tRNA(Gln) amidotransferase subunit C|nr:Asp-tRNA(Asn)/Glu-tRNA(Gln) amidotransferase subunit GatC [Ignavibacteria bacterium]MCU7503647.1 Asp-tRNA(Asn)/Glu-tRNA(Gln) amidotransferase subunit GatC [Ignavibacteria bacterium]MCU7517870.1 Asp-tRNA(Asn)/Glu-tRNA(Gln) amidotransferase subunit GatC [Ignavibacteria bacterium]